MSVDTGGGGSLTLQEGNDDLQLRDAHGLQDSLHTLSYAVNDDPEPGRRLPSSEGG
jgi:hypothetical protein